jgi:hypothetical protein
MKKQKVYSVSDFAGVTVSTIVDDSKWVIDSVIPTRAGEFSGKPLFEVQFKQYHPSVEDADGMVDATAELVANRTYFVREGRPMYKELLRAWDDVEEDIEDFNSWVDRTYEKKTYSGHVERLSGVTYTKRNKRGVVVQRSRMEAWYIQGSEEGQVLDDFVYLCNKGVYVPLVDEAEKPVADPVAEMIKGLSPEVIAAIKAMK